MADIPVGALAMRPYEAMRYATQRQRAVREPPLRGATGGPTGVVGD